MNKLLIICNGALALLGTLFFFQGLTAGIFLLVVNGISLGAIYGNQKKIFYILALAFNLFFIAAGLLVTILQINDYKALSNDQLMAIVLSGSLIFVLVILPILNIKTVWKKYKT